MRARLGALSLAVFALAGCQSGSDSHHGARSSSYVASGDCAHVSLFTVEDHGVGFTALGSPRLEAAFESTAGLVNRWMPGGGEQLASMWPGAVQSSFVAVCYFGGQFTTKDGRTFNRAVIETDGSSRSVLVVAGSNGNPVAISPPPTHL